MVCEVNKGFVIQPALWFNKFIKNKKSFPCDLLLWTTDNFSAAAFEFNKYQIYQK